MLIQRQNQIPRSQSGKSYPPLMCTSKSWSTVEIKQINVKKKNSARKIHFHELLHCKILIVIVMKGHKYPGYTAGLV